MLEKFHSYGCTQQICIHMCIQRNTHTAQLQHYLYYPQTKNNLHMPQAKWINYLSATN